MFRDYTRAPFEVTDGLLQLRARASKPGRADSRTLTQTYRFTCAEPVVTPLSGAFAGSHQVGATTHTAESTITYDRSDDDDLEPESPSS